MTHKYIQHSELGFVAWKRSDLITHRDMARTMKQHLGSIVSAGFVWFENGIPSCYGRSESLSLDSLPNDSEKFKKQIGFK